MEKNDTVIARLGVEDYERILSIQLKLNSARNAGQIGDTIIYLQHQDVYTAGIHFKDSADNLPFTLYRINRGGYLTYHGPGQIVLYFIRDIHRSNENMKDLIEKIQSAVVITLKDWGIDSYGLLHEKTGVWVQDKKVCSIGLGLIGFSTIHGMALNVATDLSKFNAINPCNFSPDVMTSMSELLGTKICVSDVQNSLERRISESLKIEKERIVTSVSELEQLTFQ